MKKKKMISMDEKDIKRIEEISIQNNLNFSQSIKYLLDNYENRLSKHIVRNNENLEILNLYINVFKTNEIKEKNIEKLMNYLIKAGDIINKIKIQKLKELKDNKKTIKNDRKKEKGD
jgi:hypothetical protein